MPSKVRLFLPAMLTVLLALASAQNVFAAVVPDQKQEVYSGDWIIIGAALNRPIWQSFIPALSPYVAIEVLLHGWGTVLPITLKIRQRTISGDVLALVSQTVPMFEGNQWVRFTFPIPLAVDAGQLYVIELDAAGETHGWCMTDGNLYPRGVAAWAGSEHPTYDFAFRTYVDARARVGGVVLPTNPYLVLAPYFAMIGLVAAAAIAVKKRRN